MSKKKIILVAIIGLVVLVAIAVTILLFGNKIEKFSTKINESMETVVSIDSDVTLKDNDIVVYEYKKNVKFTDATKAEVTVTTKSLNSNFVLEEVSDFETVENIERSNLINLDLKKEYFEEYTLENNVLTFKVTKENINKVCKNANLEILEDAVFTITLENEKIINMTCAFKTLSSKDVSISLAYKY